MDLWDVEVICAVAAYKKYSDAAYHLSVTDSSVSKRIRRVEEELGVRIFERATKNSDVVLTPAGEQLIEDFRSIRHSQQRIRSKATVFQASTTKDLTVGYVRHVGGFFEQDAISGFIIEHPDVSVTYLTAGMMDLIRMLFSDGISAAFIAVMDGFNEADSPFSLLADEDFVIDEYFYYNVLSIGLPASHPLARGSVIRRDQYPQLSRETFLQPVTQKGDDYSFYRENIRKILGMKEAPRMRYVDQSVPAIPLALVEAGVGVLPQACVVPRQIGGVRFVPMQDPGAGLTNYFVFRRSTATPALLQFRNHVLRMSEELRIRFPRVR